MRARSPARPRRHVTPENDNDIQPDPTFAAFIKDAADAQGPVMNFAEFSRWLRVYKPRKPR